MYSAPGDTTSLVPGFPIRTSSDQRSVDSSPRHIAASHVLHRLPVPRHPPCALKHLQHKKPITEKNYTTTNHTTLDQPQRTVAHTLRPDARNHYPQIKHHTPPPSGATTTTPHAADPTRRVAHLPVSHTRDEEMAGLLPQSPIVCLAVPHPDIPHSRTRSQRLSCTRTRHPLQAQAHPTNRSAHRTPHDCGRG